MSEQKILKDSPSTTSSPVSADGPSASPSLDGPPTDPSGPEVAPASPSAQQGRVPESATSATFGPSSNASSASAALQRSLESRLSARLDGLGSREYKLTSKHWDMEWGEPMWARRASTRRTSAKDSGGAPSRSGWQTPKGTGGGNVSRGHGRKNELLAEGEAKAAGWTLAGWLSPTAQEAGNKNSSFAKRNADRGLHCCPSLESQAAKATLGEATSGGPAKTASTDGSQPDLTKLRLNPAFSLWLMGYPRVWAKVGQATLP